MATWIWTAHASPVRNFSKSFHRIRDDIRDHPWFRVFDAKIGLITLTNLKAKGRRREGRLGKAARGTKINRSSPRSAREIFANEEGGRGRGITPAISMPLCNMVRWTIVIRLSEGHAKEFPKRWTSTSHANSPSNIVNVRTGGDTRKDRGRYSCYSNDAIIRWLMDVSIHRRHPRFDIEMTNMCTTGETNSQNSCFGLAFSLWLSSLFSILNQLEEEVKQFLNQEYFRWLSDFSSDNQYSINFIRTIIEYWLKIEKIQPILYFSNKSNFFNLSRIHET